MRRPDFSTLVQECLHQMERGAPVSKVLEEHPEGGDELRELLLAAAQLRGMGERWTISRSAMARSRSRMLAAARRMEDEDRQHAQAIRLPRFSYAALATATVVLGILGAGAASAQSLPGDALYPMKLAAERITLDANLSPQARLERETNYDARRAAEVRRLLAQEAERTVLFAGELEQDASGAWEVAGIPVLLTNDQAEQARQLRGATVEVYGQTLPTGSVALDSLATRLFAFSGSLSAVSNTSVVIDGLTVELDPATLLQGQLQNGARASISAARLGENRLSALSIRVLTE